jgi:uncharacterized protein with HEPN domain
MPSDPASTALLDI